MALDLLVRPAETQMVSVFFARTGVVPVFGCFHNLWILEVRIFFFVALLLFVLCVYLKIDAGTYSVFHLLFDLRSPTTGTGCAVRYRKDGHICL